MPRLILEGNTLEVVEETRLLGLTIRSDMKWVSNTEIWLEKEAKDYGYLED